MKLSEIITPVNTTYGAPMGRPNKGVKPETEKTYSKRVSLDAGGYDKGGAYWGLGDELRVEFTKDLSYVKFYRINSSFR